MTHLFSTLSSRLVCRRAAWSRLRLLVPAVAARPSEGEGVRRGWGEWANSRSFHEYKMAESKEVEVMDAPEKLRFISRNLQVCVREILNTCFRCLLVYMKWGSPWPAFGGHAIKP